MRVRPCLLSRVFKWARVFALFAKCRGCRRSPGAIGLLRQSRYHGRWNGSAVRCGPRFPLTRLRPRSSSYTAKARPCAWRPHFLRDGLLRGPFPVADSYLWRIRIWIVCTRPLFGALLSVSCRRLPSLCLYLVGSVSVTSLCLPPSICSLCLSSPVALSALLYVALWVSRACPYSVDGGMLYVALHMPRTALVATVASLCLYYFFLSVSLFSVYITSLGLYYIFVSVSLFSVYVTSLRLSNVPPSYCSPDYPAICRLVYASDCPGGVYGFSLSVLLLSLCLYCFSMSVTVCMILNSPSWCRLFPSLCLSRSI